MIFYSSRPQRGVSGPFQALVIGLLGLLSAHGARAQDAALLPLDGPPALTRALDASLTLAVLRRSRIVILDPATVQARLGQHASTRAACVAAEDDLQQADKAVLYMNRQIALDSAQRAVTRLHQTLGRYGCPTQFSQAYGALAQARLLHPPDEPGAIKAFRLALDIDPRYQPDPDKRTPVIRQLLDQARQKWQHPHPPSLGLLRQIAKEVGVTRLFWLAVRADGPDHLVLQLALVNEQGQLLEQRQLRRVEQKQLLAQTTLWISQSLRTDHQPLAATAIVPVESKTTSPSRGTTRPKTTVRPSWYGRWWVWTAVGVVLTGAAVGLAVSLGARSEPGPPLYDIRIHPEPEGP